MTRDEARAAFRDAGITYKALAPEPLDNLRPIDERMKESSLAGEICRMSEKGLRLVETGNGARTVLRRQSNHFKNREAVTFKPDGYADVTQVRPVPEGFTALVAAMQPETVPAP